VGEDLAEDTQPLDVQHQHSLFARSADSLELIPISRDIYAMTTRVIVSYDDTDNDRDALALGRVFAELGAEVALAYVSHSDEADHATALLERGAQTLAGNVATHVVLNASTGDGLRALAEREQADIVVFGSEYRTAAGHVQPGTSARRLLDGGPAAVALAPAGFRGHNASELNRIGVLSDDGETSVSDSARALAYALGGTVVRSGREAADFLVVGSRPEAPKGHVLVSAVSDYAIETATVPVLVVPRGVTVAFGAALVSA
jgi:nucleotide-binding universal stress UspA family protein